MGEGVGLGVEVGVGVGLGDTTGDGMGEGARLLLTVVAIIVARLMTVRGINSSIGRIAGINLSIAGAGLFTFEVFEEFDLAETFLCFLASFVRPA